jgi:hypothetical protein
MKQETVKKTTVKKTLLQYLSDLGQEDPTNKFLIDEIIDTEQTIIDLKTELKKTGVINSKGRLNPACHGIRMFTRIKIDLLTKLSATVQDRNKLKTAKRPDGTQLSLDDYMNEAAGF